MFSRWISSWETVGHKRIRRALFTESNIVTIIIDAGTQAEQIRRIETRFEAGLEANEFRIRSHLVDLDPAGATLMEIEVDDQVVDLDVYDPGVDPGPRWYFGLADTSDRA